MELKVCLPFNSLIVSLADSIIMFISIFFPLLSYNISHKIMPYRKETSLEADCNYHVIAECVLFVVLEYALIFIFLQIGKFLPCLCAASSLRRGGGRWCNGAVTSS